MYYTQPNYSVQIQRLEPPLTTASAAQHPSLPIRPGRRTRCRDSTGYLNMSGKNTSNSRSAKCLVVPVAQKGAHGRADGSFGEGRC